MKEQLSAFVRSVNHLLHQVEYRIVPPWGDDYDDLCRLRYKSFFMSGILGAKEEKSLPSEQDARGRLFGVYIDSLLMSTIKISAESVEDKTGSFDEEALSILRDEGIENFVTGTWFASDPEQTRNYPQLAYITIRLMMVAMQYYKPDSLACIIRLDHKGFYQRIFGARFEPITGATEKFGDVKAGVVFTPPEMDWSAIYRRFPFFSSAPLEADRLFGAMQGASQGFSSVRPIVMTSDDLDPFASVTAKIVYQTEHPKQIGNVIHLVGKLIRSEGYEVDTSDEEYGQIGKAIA